MNEKINRNDPCPCGSGKKYKKCCGANEAISITHILEKEIDEIQTQILQFALNHYDSELEESFEEYKEDLFIPDEEIEQFYSFVHIAWFTLFQPFDDGRTILEKFISYEGKRIQRPKLRQILQSWTNARAIVGEILSIHESLVTIKAGYTGEEIEIVRIDEDFPAAEGNFFLGIILPYGQKYVFFHGPFALPELGIETALAHIEDGGLQAGYEDPLEYVEDFFMEILSELPMLIGLKEDSKSIEALDPIYREVAEIFQTSLKRFDESPETVDTGIYLWSQFCEKRPKRIKNPNLYAAALHYLVSTVIPLNHSVTQKELAEYFGVPTGSLSSIYREIDDILLAELPGYETAGEIPASNPLLTEQAMRNILAGLEGHEFESIEEAKKMIDAQIHAPKSLPKGKKEQAQQLVYEAFEAEGVARYRLAEKALKLDPDCVDAYNILAEAAPGLEETAELYQKGMTIAEKQLGKKFFKENKGYFWGLIETRPFMRAKFNYAQTLMALGKAEEAIGQMKELLELNPQDNQGVRSYLFIGYVDNGDLANARKLLDQYDEGLAEGAFNRALLEILEHGFSTKAVKRMKEAKKENKHVIQYLSGKKRLPSELPDYYGFGDENEAIVYAGEHLHLWRKISGLSDWLKKM